VPQKDEAWGEKTLVKSEQSCSAESEGSAEKKEGEVTPWWKEEKKRGGRGAGENLSGGPRRSRERGRSSQFE